MSTPFKVKAVYDYSSPHDDDLSFKTGTIITVNDEEDADWYGGEYVDDAGVKQEGIFPRNFVEKYEPTAPPRPTRQRTKKEEPAPAVELDSQPLPPAPAAAPKTVAEEPEEEEDAPVAAALHDPPAPKPAEPAPAAPSPSTSSKPPRSAAPAASAAPPKQKSSGPPPVAEKPVSGSFKDRIAAFNKPAAPPIAPFKPGGLGGNEFIKKPYVPPPPSRNAYIPPPREAPPPKAYRRDEDPEIKEKEAENLENAERAGLVAGGSADTKEGEGEDEPKPLSLKERMALLQKQQQEQAQRHADTAQKKEKPKRPPKKRIDSTEGPAEAPVPAEAEAPPPVPPSLTRESTDASSARASIDEPHPPRAPHPQRRKSSRAAETHDGNEADLSGAGDTTEGQEDLTEREDSDEKVRHVATAAKQDDEALDEEEEVDEEDEGEEEEIDPEIRRKEELRARMAKMSGAGGAMMGGMFGLPGMMNPQSASGAPPPRKKKPAEHRVEDEDDGTPAANTRAPPVPTMMALPGLSAMKSPPEKAAAKDEDEEEEHDEEREDDATPLRSPHQENVPPSRKFFKSDLYRQNGAEMSQVPIREAGGAPPIPGGRPAPPPVPSELRSVPPPPSRIKSPSVGSESDDEASDRNVLEAPSTPRGDVTTSTRAPPPPPRDAPASPRSSTSQDPTSPIAPVPPSKRNSRPPPPIPGAAPAVPPAQTRAPPPPPPGQLSRTSTRDSQLRSPTVPSRPAPHKEEEDDEDEEEEVTAYEGDYDTDIASSAPHRDALHSHDRESSFEGPTPVRSPVAEAPASFPPPVPSGGASRAPPPIPSQPPPPPSSNSRKSGEAPRVAPPLPPLPPKETPGNDANDDYDPFNYTAAAHSGIPFMPAFNAPAQTPRSPPVPSSRPAEDSYHAEPPVSPPTTRAPPQPPAASRAPPPRPSQEIPRPSGGPPPRRSTDMNRPSMESGHVAHELDLASGSGWWLQPNSLPPQLQGRKDIFSEFEESTETKRGGKTTITRDIYILYQDYSQTVITVRFDPHDTAGSDASLEQRHEPPPRTLRQDQLEDSYERFSRPISEAVAKLKDTVVGDGTPQALIAEMLRPYKDALKPVGTRAYGALVYSNLANASTVQNDEIRPGDIVSIRNAKFQGKHGPMHAKYSMEVGKPDHVGIVAEWDGTKKKVRAWEQGRDGKKVKMESYKLDDLRSGEVKVWRVMARAWVGWDGN